MAAIELRDAIIYFEDGTAGTGVVAAATPCTTDTTVNVNTVVMTNATVNTLVPVGARFTVNTANNTTTYTVTGREPSGNGPTTCITFTPAWGTNAPAVADVITFLPQRVAVKIGEGNLTWTEAKEYNYVLDRGDLDTVRQGDEQPVELSLDFMFEEVTTGTSEDITVVDALKRAGEATEWVSSSEDQCEPYAVNLIVFQCTPCGSTEDAMYTFPDFRWESLEYNIGDATISTTGRCNASSVTAERGTYDACS